MSLSEFELQRRALTVEEHLHEMRNATLDFCGEETAEPVKQLDDLIVKTRKLQDELRVWFAP